MTNGIVAIYDSDVNYLHHLSEYLRSREDFPYDIIVFSDLDSLNKYSLQPIDILVTSIIPEFIMEKDIGDVFYLSCDSDTTYDNYVCLFKYQPADVLLRKIMENCKFSLNNSCVFPNNDCSVIGVYSPINRCGKTSLSISLGLNLSEYGSSLLISFDTFSILKCFMADNCFRDISDLLFYLKEDSDNFQNKLLSMTHKILELNFICPPTTPNRLNSNSCISWCQLIREIVRTGLYRNIILDISDGFFSLENFFELCDIVYMPQLNNIISSEKINSFFEYLSHTTNVNQGMFKKILLPCFPDISSQSMYLNTVSQSDFAYFSKNLIEEFLHRKQEVINESAFN